MIPCKLCSGEVALRAMKLTINRQRGVYHWIEHTARENSCCAVTGYEAQMFKPYPKKDCDKDWFKMIERWNNANR